MVKNINTVVVSVLIYRDLMKTFMDNILNQSFSSFLNLLLKKFLKISILIMLRQDITWCLFFFFFLENTHTLSEIHQLVVQNSITKSTRVKYWMKYEMHSYSFCILLASWNAFRIFYSLPPMKNAICAANEFYRYFNRFCYN